MRLIDEDHITQAVIACHADAEDARLRDVMTSLVQHLHAFAREVKLSEDEWRAGLRFLGEAANAAGASAAAPAAPVASNGSAAPPRELEALSDVLGLTTLVQALNRHRPPGAGARPTVRATFVSAAAAPAAGPVAALLRALGREA